MAAGLSRSMLVVGGVGLSLLVAALIGLGALLTGGIAQHEEGGRGQRPGTENDSSVAAGAPETESGDQLIQAAVQDDELKALLKRLALATHRFHDEYKSFPGHDRVALDGPQGLSWRVHLLPYLDQRELYNEFHLREPWDSDHNRQLIERMPDIYRSPGVTEAGRTAWHVFTGEGTPYASDRPPAIVDLQAGGNNTVLCVMGGAGTATEWTRPGGIPWDPERGVAILGTPPHKRGFPAFFGSGQPAIVPPDMPGDVLRGFVEPADRRESDDRLLVLFEPTAEEREQERRRLEFETRFAGRPEQEESLPANATRWPRFPDDELRTRMHQVSSGVQDEWVFGTQVRGDSSSGLSWRVYILPDVGHLLLYKKFHLNEPWNSDHNLTLVAEMPGIFKTPGLAKPGMTTIHVFSGGSAPFSGDGPLRRPLEFQDWPPDQLMFVMAGLETATEWTRPGGIPFDAETGMAALGTPPVERGFPMAFTDRSLAVIPTTYPDEKLRRLVAISVAIDSDRDGLELFGQDAHRLQLAEQQRWEEQESPEAKLKNIAGSLRNYVLNGGTGVRSRDNPELSWRVHLLFDIDPQLYAEFHLDEPWDSPHNLSFLNRMPDAYKTPGVDEPGKTVMHVFSGPGTPLDETDITWEGVTDGPENTLLAVMGGPESAVEWTRPDGMAFDPGDPFQKLGSPGEDGYLALMMDESHSILTIPVQTPPDVLALLIQHADGRNEELLDRLRSLPGGNSLLPDLLIPIPAADFAGHPKRKLSFVGIAMHHHADAYGVFSRVDGGPQGNGTGLSWRVHLLPFLGASALYEEFHLDEPWDSPHNAALIELMPEVYRCERSEAGKTTLHVFTGEGTPFGSERPAGISDITDGSSLTVMLALGRPETAIEWTRPGGIPYDPDRPLAQLSAAADDGYPVVMFDGSVRVLLERVAPEIAAALITHQDATPLHVIVQADALSTWDIPDEEPWNDNRFVFDERHLGREP